MTKKRLFTLSTIFILPLVFISLNSALAQNGLLPEPTGPEPTGPGRGDGNYALNDFITLAIKVSQFILGLVGSLSLLMFVYGGITFILSAGSADKVNEAKPILVASVVGLIIVFSSWLIIRFFVSMLGATNNFDGSVNTSLLQGLISII